MGSLGPGGRDSSRPLGPGPLGLGPMGAKFRRYTTGKMPPDFSARRASGKNPPFGPGTTHSGCQSALLAPPDLPDPLGRLPDPKTAEKHFFPGGVGIKTLATDREHFFSGGVGIKTLATDRVGGKNTFFQEVLGSKSSPPVGSGAPWAPWGP